jgi:hypothetical protein
VVGDLEKALPNAITNRAVVSGNELLIPLDDARAAIAIASQSLIAVLGVEVFRILDDGLGTETYSGYEFNFNGNWQDYVGLNNDAALRFLDENSYGEGYGYILTSTSENEFRSLATVRALFRGQ